MRNVRLIKGCFIDIFFGKNNIIKMTYVKEEVMAHKTGLEDYYVLKIKRNFISAIRPDPVRRELQKVPRKCFSEVRNRTRQIL